MHDPGLMELARRETVNNKKGSYSHTSVFCIPHSDFGLESLLRGGAWGDALLVSSSFSAMALVALEV